MSPCSRKAREYGLKLLFLKTEVEKSGYTKFPAEEPNPMSEKSDLQIEHSVI